MISVSPSVVSMLVALFQVILSIPENLGCLNHWSLLHSNYSRNH